MDFGARTVASVMSTLGRGDVLSVFDDNGRPVQVRVIHDRILLQTTINVASECVCHGMRQQAFFTAPRCASAIGLLANSHGFVCPSIRIKITGRMELVFGMEASSAWFTRKFM